MKKLIILLIYLPFAGFSQNLVKNPSFEEGLPEKTIKSRNPEGDAGRPFLPGWWVPTCASPDLFNSVSSSAKGVLVPKARTGKGMAGLVLGESKNLSTFYGGSYKEYLEGELTEPLLAGKTYCVEFYLGMDQTTAFFGTNIGAYLSDHSIMQKNKTGLDAVPQIKLEKDTLFTSYNGWVKVCGKYKAKGGEKYITIGSFGQRYMIPMKTQDVAPRKTRGNVFRNAYYYLDDVAVYPDEETDCCKENQRKSQVLFLIDNWGDFFMGDNRSVFNQAMMSTLAEFDESTEVMFVTKGDTRDSILFVPVAQMRNDLDYWLGKMTVRDPEMKMSATISFYASQIERRDLKSVQLLVISPGKMKISSGTKKSVMTCYAKDNTSFSVLQIQGKQSASLRNFTQKVNGIYNYSPGTNYSKEMKQTGFYVNNIDQKLDYKNSGNKKIYFFLGGAAILAAMLIQIV